MKNIWYRILRYFAKEYLKRYEANKIQILENKAHSNEIRCEAGNDACKAENMLLLINLEIAWENYNKVCKKVKP